MSVVIIAVLPTPSVPPPDPVARLSDILLKNRRKQPSITPHREVRTRDPTHAYDRYSHVSAWLQLLLRII